MGISLNDKAGRAGFVGYTKLGRFVHYCACGEWGAYGEGVHLAKGEFGKWFCKEHRPQQPSEEERGKWR